MKKIILLITFTFCCVNLFAQQTSTPTPTPKNDGPSRRAGEGSFQIEPNQSAPATSGSSRSISSGGSISGGVLNGKATSLPKPPYPAAAKAVRASGPVGVQVTIDEEGNVISASAVSGHPLLRQAAEKAALGAKFSPTSLSGQLVKVTGIITYNFVGISENWLMIGKYLGMRNSNGLVEAGRLLPQNFAEQKKSLDTMIEENTTTGIDDVINTIETRLRFGKSGNWDFQIGTAIGHILADPTDSNSLRLSLLKIRQLTDFPAEDVMAWRLEPLKDLANFSNVENLTKDDTAKIVRICNSIR
jgi:TonB family protein